MTAERPIRVLFICTHNSARSQMAEGLLRAMGGPRYQALSAGTEATAVRPLAIQAMAEVGIDISAQTSKTLDRYLAERLDYVVTVCDRANAACPVFPGSARRLHWSIDDPAAVTGPPEAQLAAYRRARDELRDRILATFLTHTA
jgi:arsenate reductase